jgi:heme/copper-type cytochrome/quinol oxidase subunit 3
LAVPYWDWAPKDQHLQGAAREQAQIFFSLYFLMTGLHATHMIIGLGILAALLWPSWKGRYDLAYHTPLECTGLYWHGRGQGSYPGARASCFDESGTGTLH